MKRREFVLLRFSVFFTLLYILVGCTENRVQMQRLQVIDSLMEAHPQAAYDSLCRFDSLEMGNASRKVVMKQRLLMAKAQNKLYLSMPTDSIFQEVVDYYDSKGSDNEKMQAYYLMGCVYRDQKEAPKAMMSYKKAVEYADTFMGKWLRFIADNICIAKQSKIFISIVIILFFPITKKTGYKDYYLHLLNIIVWEIL